MDTHKIELTGKCKQGTTISFYPYHNPVQKWENADIIIAKHIKGTLKEYLVLCGCKEGFAVLLIDARKKEKLLLPAFNGADISTTVSTSMINMFSERCWMENVWQCRKLFQMMYPYLCEKARAIREIRRKEVEMRDAERQRLLGRATDDTLHWIRG
jgi:hypothetical protein